MAENQFKAGDVVILKSNRLHRMTIEKQNNDSTYLCVWQDKNNKKKTDDYAGVVLEKYISHVGVTILR